MVSFQTVKGTHDILPEEVGLWRCVEEKVRQMMEAYNYLEIRTPIFEHTELFSRSIGQDTDIVGKEMYTFSDKGNRSLTLSPEGTAPVVRAYIQNNLGAQSPQVKLFYIAPMFRQENPQQGRFRQFHQYGIEAIGSLDPAQDVEVITLAMGIYSELGLQKLSLRMNSVGCRICRPIYRDVLRNFLKSRISALCKDCVQRHEENPLRILDCKEPACREQTEDIPFMIDHLCPECSRHFAKVQELLSQLDVAYVLDGRLVRGLDYYTKTAFEVLSGELGAQDALGGGGRYDDLIEMLGGSPTPAVGFAAGIERLLMVLSREKRPRVSPRSLDLFVVVLGDDAKKVALKVLRQLRHKLVRCDTDFVGRSLKAQLRAANRLGARYALIIGEEELHRGKAILRDMDKSQQEEIDLNESVQEVCDRLARRSP
ncbi:MAG: histidyl-tRNA synthetase [candidate division Zixibacteria bacterium SM23_81]|nr:MAG: histidyl-tRNA synthetase [candidate division Zixibacteria bacterium SM23_81]